MRFEPEDVNWEEVQKAYETILEYDVLEDRLEYTWEDLAKGHDLNESSAKQLEHLIQQDPAYIYNHQRDPQLAERVLEALVENFHNDHDGWSTQAKGVLNSFYADIGLYVRTAPQEQEQEQERKQ